MSADRHVLSSTWQCLAQPGSDFYTPCLPSRPQLAGHNQFLLARGLLSATLALSAAAPLLGLGLFVFLLRVSVTGPFLRRACGQFSWLQPESRALFVRVEFPHVSRPTIGFPKSLRACFDSPPPLALRKESWQD